MVLHRENPPPLLVRQFVAELLGTFLFVLIGDASIYQMKAWGPVDYDSQFRKESFISVAFAYGLGLMIGVLISGGISGCHLNPAITLAEAVVGKVTWIQVPVYWAAQYLGAFLAAIILYAVYFDSYKNLLKLTVEYPEKEFAESFATYPHDRLVGLTVAHILDQLVATAMLQFVVSSIQDKKNMNFAPGAIPITLGFSLTGIHLAFSTTALCAINPARDFSPYTYNFRRLFSAMAGLPETFSRGPAYFWIPWIIPHLGAIMGAGIYYFSAEFLA